MLVAQRTETAALENHTDESQPINHQRKHSVSISMPTSPVGDRSKNTKKVLFKDNGELVFVNGTPDSSAASNTASTHSKQLKFHSQPMPKGCAFEEAVNIPHFPNHPTIKRLKDKRYDSFKTWSGKLERQLTHLRGKPTEDSRADSTGQKPEKEALPVDRYFDALEGPELETLRVCAYHCPIF